MIVPPQMGITREVLKAVEDGRITPEKAKQFLKGLGETALDFTPVVGDVKALAYDLPKQLSQGDYLGGMFSAASVVPVVGDLANTAYKAPKFAERMKLPTSKADLQEMAGATANTYEMVKNPDYYKKNKNTEFTVIEMTPDQYLLESADILGKDYEDLLDTISRSDRMEDMRSLAKSDKEVQMPYLDFKKNSQEGNHRAMAAKELGIDKIPVLVIKETK